MSTLQVTVNKYFGSAPQFFQSKYARTITVIHLAFVLHYEFKYKTCTLLSQLIPIYTSASTSRRSFIVGCV